MPIISFFVVLVCVLVAAGIFSYGLWLLSRNNLKAGGTMNLGFGIGLLGVVLSAIIYGFFYL